MYSEGLKLTNFKNYETQSFSFSPKINVFVGDNGMGKTNVLDALHYLCMCKSHFLLPDKTVVRHGEDFFRIEGAFVRKSKKEKIVCKYKVKSRKVIERNRLAYKKLSDHIGLFPMIMVSPDNSTLITGGSENRRQFIDVLLVQLNPLYLNHLIAYNKVLQQRNAFLKKIDHPNELDTALLQVYNQQLIAPAAYIFEQRKNILNLLKPVFVNYYHLISGDREKVDFEYSSQLTEKPLDELLTDSQEKDVWLQRTTKGIHKDDIKLIIDDYPLKKIASQGQLKSYLLALKLAQYILLKEQAEVKPVLLLDDIFDKLDKKRVKHLLDLLMNPDFGQIFITDTHENRVTDMLVNESECGKFYINNGTAKL